MNEVNKTLYIPLYGKSFVSKRSLFIVDKKAEEIWNKSQFKLKRKSKSKWLAYYMAIRASVFDNWVKEQIETNKNAIVIHIGCGLDSRVVRVNKSNVKWYDIDFDEVIEERKKFYSQTDTYKMISTDIREDNWLNNICENENSILVMEGVSMYLNIEELKNLFNKLSKKFKKFSILLDSYTVLAAKLSKIKNPVKEVGVTKVYGLDAPLSLQTDCVSFIKEHEIIPQKYINELNGIEKFIFKHLYAGKLSKRLYKLFEYKK